MFSAPFILSFMGLTFYRKHLLSALLCLEGIMLSLFIAFSLWTLKLDAPNFSSIPMVLITFSACETGTGLALLISTTRTRGTDHLLSLNTLKC